MPLIDYQLDLLKVSLWATSRKEYEANYPADPPANFDRVKASLRLIAKRKTERKSLLPLVKLHQPVDRRNYGSVEALLGIAIETGCDILSFSPFTTQDHMFSSFLPAPQELRQLLRQLAGIKRAIRGLPIAHTIDTALLRYRIGGAVWKKLPCYIGWLHARIKPDGTVLPCNSYGIPLGNLNEAGLKHIWNAEGFRRFRKQSMSRDGLAAIASRFDCYFCCHVSDNVRVHRRYRWIAPFFNR